MHDDPVPVHRDGHDGEGGHVHRYAWEGLYHPRIIRDFQKRINQRRTTSLLFMNIYGKNERIFFFFGWVGTLLRFTLCRNADISNIVVRKFRKRERGHFQ